MQNVAPSRALMRRSRTLLQIAFVIICAGIFLATIGVALFVVPLASTSSSSFSLYDTVRNLLFLAGLFLIFVALAMAVRALTWKIENDQALVTGRVLAQTLDESFTFIRNISKRGLGYIDAVLIGLPGILVFRVLDSDGEYLNEGTNWLKRGRGGEWHPMRANPTQHVVDDVKSLRTYLSERGFQDVPIFGVVVFIKDDPAVRLTLKDPALPATHLSSLGIRLQGNYLAKDRIDGPTVKALVDLLYDK